jgi:hypothetical protein
LALYFHLAFKCVLEWNLHVFDIAFEIILRNSGDTLYRANISTNTAALAVFQIDVNTAVFCQVNTGLRTTEPAG